jgi:hypothetical protein
MTAALVNGEAWQTGTWRYSINILSQTGRTRSPDPATVIVPRQNVRQQRHRATSAPLHLFWTRTISRFEYCEHMDIALRRGNVEMLTTSG